MQTPQGTYLTHMSSMSSVAVLVKYMCLFLALEALHDWYQPSSPASLLSKWDALLVSSKLKVLSFTLACLNLPQTS